jgi:hypothetical protein
VQQACEISTVAVRCDKCKRRAIERKAQAERAGSSAVCVCTAAGGSRAHGVAKCASTRQFCCTEQAVGTPKDTDRRCQQYAMSHCHACPSMLMLAQGHALIGQTHGRTAQRDCMPVGGTKASTAQTRTSAETMWFLMAAACRRQRQCFGAARHATVGTDTPCTILRHDRMHICNYEVCSGWHVRLAHRCASKYSHCADTQFVCDLIQSQG